MAATAHPMEPSPRELLPERILCAAIHFVDNKVRAHMPVNIEIGLVLCGHRHCSIFPQTGRTVAERKEMGVTKEIQGFLTSKNRFVTREEAAIIATEQKQLIPPIQKVAKLYSEDLY